ncbi:MAG: hypothetical protein JO277_09940 [Candidatus Eremiobacteraeota bacterium]|nr:hypothetical protein [Candidatus Eremiobacteraeota bacterium]
MVQTESKPVKQLVFDPSDSKVHVFGGKKSNEPPVTKCGKTGQSYVSSASGFWGPEGRGWADVCRECHRIERGLKEPLL